MLNACPRTDALRAAIELDLFTGIGEGASTIAQLAEWCSASERGVRTPAVFDVCERAARRQV